MSEENVFTKEWEEAVKLWDEIVNLCLPKICEFIRLLLRINNEAFESNATIPITVVQTLMSVINLHTIARDEGVVKGAMMSLVEWCIDEIKFLEKNGYWRFLGIGGEHE